MPIWHGSPLQRRQGRAGRGVDRQLLSTPRASRVGGAGIGRSTGRIQTVLGLREGIGRLVQSGGRRHSKVRRKDAQSILGSGGEKPHAC